MKTPNRITEKDYILAQRRASRALELEMFRKQIHGRTVLHKSHKAYNRQVAKRVEMD